jgi:signal transduction histidine kinase
VNETVLNLWIVDDEPAMCLGVGRSMENFAAVYDDLGESVRCRVTAMESGEAFMERLDREAPPDLLLLDGKLPGIDGIEVMQVLERRGAEIVTVMITAYATLENAVRATKLGAFDFLAKPFTPNELRHTVSKACREIVLTRRARRLEAERRQVRFEFLSVLAHELKSPLAAVEGYVDMLRHGPVDAAVLDRMEARIGGMRKLIADLLDLTAIESGRRKRELQEVDLREVAIGVAANAAVAAAARRVAIAVEDGPGCRLRADRGEMEMLLSNLVSNAVKYNVEGGRVTIAVAPDGAGASLSVSDTGIGIADADKARLFAEFSRIRNDRTRGIEGSGLGLSIVSRIAGLYGGRVEVASREGEGSTFAVRLAAGGEGVAERRNTAQA